MSEEMNLGSNQQFQEGDIVKGVAEQVDEKSVTVSIEGAPFDGILGSAFIDCFIMTD